jgi:hypothetical protein
MASGIQDLEWFARESLLRGLGKPEIRKAMLDAGWTEDQVRNAVDAYADAVFPVPIPKPRPHLSARDAFLWGGRMARDINASTGIRTTRSSNNIG